MPRLPEPGSECNGDFRQLSSEVSNESSLINDGRMISVSNESVRSQPDFRCPYDCRFSDVLAAGSASSAHFRNDCACVAGSNFDLEMVSRQSGEIIRSECNGDISTISSAHPAADAVPC